MAGNSQRRSSGSVTMRCVAWRRESRSPLWQDRHGRHRWTWAGAICGVTVGHGGKGMCYQKLPALRLTKLEYSNGT